MATSIEIESFYDKGRKAGALIRRLSGESIQTFLVFRAEGGPVIRLSQETWYSADVLNWIKYSYVDQTEDPRTRTQACTERLVHERTTSSIPSYAAHVVLKNFLLAAEPRRDFNQFDEGVGQQEAAPAAFVAHGIETVATPWGSRKAQKMVLLIDGRASNSFWCIDGSVVKSDWQGATSYATSDVEFVLQDLDDEVKKFLTPILNGNKPRWKASSGRRNILQRNTTETFPGHG